MAFMWAISTDTKAYR